MPVYSYHAGNSIRYDRHGLHRHGIISKQRKLTQTVSRLHSPFIEKADKRHKQLILELQLKIMRLISFATVPFLALALVACSKYETIPNPALNAHDTELLALAPQPPREVDVYRARYRINNPTGEAPGTIVVDTDTRFLYLVESGGTALRYPISPGADAYQWKGRATIGRKAEWPGWTPGPEAHRLNPDLPGTVAGGPNSPLGSRGLYLYEGNKDTQYRIHGTNEPESIGDAVSLGCIRMQNIDAIDLYNRVKLGTQVVVR